MSRANLDYLNLTHRTQGISIVHDRRIDIRHTVSDLSRAALVVKMTKGMDAQLFKPLVNGRAQIAAPLMEVSVRTKEAGHDKIKVTKGRPMRNENLSVIGYLVPVRLNLRAALSVPPPVKEKGSNGASPEANSLDYDA